MPSRPSARALIALLCVVATTAAAAPEPAVRDLPFFYDLYSFRNDDGGTTVVAAVAVEAGKLRPRRRGSEMRYRFDLRFVLADTVTTRVFPSIDSVFVASPGRLGGDHLLHTYVEVEVPPSDATVQRVVLTDANRPGVGQLYTSAYPVRDYGGKDLMLSDIAFGLPDSRTGWSRRGITLALLPTSQFPESEFDVYYEIYNLPAGTPYETEIAIEPVDGEDGRDGERRVGAVFTGESKARADGSAAELRRVQSALSRGRYRLTVTIRDLRSGATAARSRQVEVGGWDGETTLVTALPRGRGEGSD